MMRCRGYPIDKLPLIATVAIIRRREMRGSRLTNELADTVRRTLIRLIVGSGKAVSSSCAGMSGIYEVTQREGTVGRMVFHDNGDYFDMADNTSQPIDERK